MLDGRRKSIEPMAARLGEVHYQALHQFVAVSPWDWRPVRRRLAELLCAALSPTAWVADDTGFPKDGSCSVGVQRQYSGTLGKPANCQLGVSVNAVTERASCPLDWRLFVPESWDEPAMAARRAACHLPDDVQHRPKWQLVLDMLDELAGWDLVPPVLLADSGYGKVGEFRAGLDARQVRYVVEVRSDTSAYPEQVRPTVAPHKGRGRHPRPRYRDKPCSLHQLAMQAGQQACVELIWRRGSKGLQRGRFLALRVRPAGVTHAGWHKRPARSCRCAGCWSNGQSASPSRPSTGSPACLRPPRWWSWSVWPGRVGEWNRTTANSKGALGLDHFEGRGFLGWHHHVTLVSVAHGFLTLERRRSPNLVASA